MSGDKYLKGRDWHLLHEFEKWGLVKYLAESETAEAPGVRTQGDVPRDSKLSQGWRGIDVPARRPVLR